MSDNALKIMSDISKYWLSENSSLNFQEINAFCDFIKSLDKPVDFKLKDGTVIKTGKVSKNTSKKTVNDILDKLR